ncbi:MAG: hypothetical protein LBI42_13115 [Chitinispirillales bacterium]|nr:hypothetical protein [Chitinispirillales bacterium]
MFLGFAWRQPQHQWHVQQRWRQRQLVDGNGAYNRNMNSGSENVNENTNNKGNGNSLRCAQDCVGGERLSASPYFLVLMYFGYRRGFYEKKAKIHD